MNVQPLDIWRQIPIGPILLVDLTLTPDKISLIFLVKNRILASMISKSTICV